MTADVPRHLAPSPRLVIVAVPGDKRARALAEAHRRHGGPELCWVSWHEVLLDPALPGKVGRRGDWLRVDSPGSNSEIWHRLARRGGLEGERPDGEWRPGRAWATGLAQQLAEIHAAAPELVPTHPEALALTDKRTCHTRLHAAGVPVPPAYDAPSSAVQFRAKMAELGVFAAFVKPRWGSSGAGVLAWRRSPRGDEQITTTVSLSATATGWRMVNDKHLHTWNNAAHTTVLLDAVLADGAVVQRWIPKRSLTVAGPDGSPHAGPFDLRILMIGGEVTVRVARVGRGPITNLHLDATRADADDALGEARTRVSEAARAAAACFPEQMCIGVDLMLDHAGRPYVIECNAWGDYLPGLTHEGLDSYALQLRHLQRLGDRVA